MTSRKLEHHKQNLKGHVSTCDGVGDTDSCTNISFEIMGVQWMQTSWEAKRKFQR